MAWTMRLPEEEEDQLTAIAEAQGRSKQEIAREAVRQYILRNRTWDEPLFSEEESFDLGGAPVTRDEIRQTVTDGYEKRMSA